MPTAESKTLNYNTRVEYSQSGLPSTIELDVFSLPIIRGEMDINELTKKMAEEIKELEANLTSWPPERISQSAVKLAIYNINLSVKVADFESESLQLETARKLEEAEIFKTQKDKGMTDSMSNAESKLQTQEIKGDELKKGAQARKLKALSFRTGDLISTAQSHLKALLSERSNLAIDNK